MHRFGNRKLSQLSDNHLKNIKKHILKRVNDPKNSTKTQQWNGFTWDAWIYSIRAEQEYRAKLLDKVLGTLGKEGEKLVKVAYSKDIS